MRYTVRHVSRFTYAPAITESVMEVRMQPRSDGAQRCLHFALTTTPQARVLMYQDEDGNIVHHFNVPARHAQLTVTAEALVECGPAPDAPDAVEASAWQALDELRASGEMWDHLAASSFTRSNGPLDEFAREIHLGRLEDPLTSMRWLMQEMYSRFDYSPRSTRVDSPIDEALQSRRGVCQDFTHVFIAAARRLGVPTRYVSGYLFHDPDGADRSSDGATHAWAEVLIPELGWVGFDPTNNILAGRRHIRIAVGRDYADVPPTRGVFKGASDANTELAVSVRVGPARSLRSGDEAPFVPWMSREAGTPVRETAEAADQQQQQQ
jgi:transglutaminase-like putative cysteine protease